jgi:hypothetical protein
MNIYSKVILTFVYVFILKVNNNQKTNKNSFKFKKDCDGTISVVLAAIGHAHKNKQQDISLLSL